MLDMQLEAQRSLGRILPRLTQRYASQMSADDWQVFSRRVEKHFPRLFSLLVTLYASHYDFFYHLEAILATAAKMWLARPAELKALDAVRENDPAWFHSNQMLGGVCYVDLFAGSLSGVREKIPYFRELGLTYLHLMPLFRSPEGNNDGGYAVSSYREVNPALGLMDELRELAAELRHNGISLVLDFIFNHTSDEHEWARHALAGDPDYQNRYWIFPDRQQPDAYEASLREIFPGEHPGAFTQVGGARGEAWVWTTFHSFQWDLNYANPALFTAMAEEMLFIANVGVEVLRLDAVAFIWKRLGTTCENLPEAHLLIQAFNALAGIAAPAMHFKSEAIVHPDEVVKYIRPDECQLSYNPLLMALLWNSLATRKVRLLAQAMRERFAIAPQCAWVNYIRCHDDIGWTFSDEDAAQLGVKGWDHRRFLNAFYTGRFPGSFARGLPFQENPKTGDMRVSGTCASLAGLENAIQSEAAESEIELSIRRILLLHSIILSIGGIPLLYLGDEIGALNDYSYRDDPAKADDSRWVHRPRANRENFARRNDPQTVEGKVYMSLRRLIELRKRLDVFAGHQMQVLEPGNDHVFGYLRSNGKDWIAVLANFGDYEQHLADDQLARIGLRGTLADLVTGETSSLTGGLTLKPYQFVWLAE